MTIKIKISLVDLGDFNTPSLSIFRRNGAGREILLGAIYPESDSCEVAITPETMIGICVDTPIVRDANRATLRVDRGVQETPARVTNK